MDGQEVIFGNVTGSGHSDVVLSAPTQIVCSCDVGIIALYVLPRGLEGSKSNRIEVHLCDGIPRLVILSRLQDDGRPQEGGEVYRQRSRDDNPVLSGCQADVLLNGYEVGRVY